MFEKTPDSVQFGKTRVYVRLDVDDTSGAFAVGIQIEDADTGNQVNGVISPLDALDFVSEIVQTTREAQLTNKHRREERARAQSTSDQLSAWFEGADDEGWLDMSSQERAGFVAALSLVREYERTGKMALPGPSKGEA